MKKIRKIIKSHWQTMLAVVIGGLLIGALLWFQLGALTGDVFAPIEINTVSNMTTTNRLADATFYGIPTSGYRVLLENSLYLPLKLPALVLSSFNINNIVALRSVAVIYGLLSAGIIYVLMRQLFTRRVANIGAILLVTSSWFLQSSRIISPVVMYLFSMSAILLIAALLKVKKRQKLTAITIVLLLAALLYTPGFTLLIPVLFLLQRKDVIRLVKNVPNWFFVVVVFLFLTLVSPLLYSTIYGDLRVLEYLGLPTVLEPIEWLKRLAIIPAYVFVRGPLEPVFNVLRLPLLDVFTSVLLILGIYSYSANIKEQKHTRIIVMVAVFSVALIALNGPMLLALLIPLVYLFVAMGVALLLQQWFTVFPKNPLARSLGVILLCIALATISVYHVKRYFIAWPNAPATKIVFQK